MRTGAGRLLVRLALAVVLLPALLLTLARLVGPDWGPVLQLQAFTPFALPLYAVGLVALVVVAAVDRRRCGRLPLLPAGAAVVAALALALHVGWFAPLLTDDGPPAADGGEPVTVMAANVLRGRADAEQLVEQVADHGVDVLAVSEITTSMLARLDAAGLRDLLPQAHGEPGEEGTIDGTMVFTAEQTSTLELTLDTTMGAVVVGTDELTVLAVHPTPPLDPDAWEEDLATVRDVADEVHPDVVLGDFNATLDHEPMRDLLDLGYRDAVELTGGGFAPTWPNAGGYGLFGVVGLLGPVAQIDHVLVRDGWAALEVDDIGLDGTDHRSVVATVAPAA